MAKQKKKSAANKSTISDIPIENIRFIVPMPGKSNWQEPDNSFTLRKLHKFTHRAGDLAIEDYQAQFLMQREYLID